MCQPGRPSPQGLGHDGSPGFAAFHMAKSPGVLNIFSHQKLALISDLVDGDEG